MNNRRTWFMLALLFVCATIAGFVIPSTLAYIAAHSDSLVNTFDAPYFTPDFTSVEVKVHKIMHNIGEKRLSAEGFQFRLEGADNAEVFTLTADKSGFASVTLPFSDADLGREHIYRLYEVNDGRKDVIYDSNVYELKVTLDVNPSNQIVAQTYIDNTPVAKVEVLFENTYNAGSVLPPTGDHTPILLYAAMMLLSGAYLVRMHSKRVSLQKR